VALAAVVGEPDAYAGELPVAYVQLKPDAKADEAELLKYAAARTPERAAVPVQLYAIESMPLTAVGKVFKPALRTDAAERAVRRMLSFLEGAGATVRVTVAPHPEHGTLIRVRLGGMPAAGREGILAQVKSKLEPLTLRHVVEWEDA
jgi:fatty-acyl-CoA synthase